MAFGIEIEQEKYWEALDSLCDLLGKPDQVYYTINASSWTDREDEDETFAETVEMGGGYIIYDMMYQLEHGKLLIGITENNYVGECDIDVCYCTDALYEYLRDETNSGALIYEDKVYDFE